MVFWVVKESSPQIQAHSIAKSRFSMKLIAIISLLLFESLNLFSQELNENYLLFSDKRESSEYIEFISDSMLLIIPNYSGKGCLLLNTDYPSTEKLNNKYEYKVNKDTLTIFHFNGVIRANYRIVENKYIENSETKEIYVLWKEFDRTPDIAVYYNRKYYWIDTPETSNGIVTKEGKKNRKLSRILNKMDTSMFDVKIYRNYEAFKNHGYKYVFGIVELIDKQRG